MKFLHFIRHSLLPHHGNNHKAKAIQNSGLLVIILLFSVFQFGLGRVEKSDPGILGYAANISPEEVVRLTNEKRASEGLPALSINSTLSQAAQAKASHMLSYDYWAHVAPDGTEPWKFFLDFDYKYRYAGENLARDFSDPVSAVNAWMASPSHRDNIMSDHYKEIGVAVIEGDLDGEDTTLIVQFFGTDLADTISVPVAQAQGQQESEPQPTQSPAPTQAPVATTSPTPQPTAEPTQEPTSVPLAEATPITTPQPVLVSPFNIRKSVSVGLIGLLMAVLVLDIVVIARRKIKRVSGRTVAHLGFFATILAIVLIARAGRIL